MSNRMPMVALRDIIVFPYMALHFEVGRDKSVAALEKAMENDQIIFLAAQKDKEISDPDPDDIYEVGTVSKIKQILKLPGDIIRVLVKGVYRAKITSFSQLLHILKWKPSSCLSSRHPMTGPKNRL